MKRIAAIAAILCMAMAVPAFSATPYKTYTRTPGEGLSETQTAYEPALSITSVGELLLGSPSDVRVGYDGNLYIADTGGKRIIVATPSGDLVRVLGSGILSAPRGVWVDGSRTVYVADEGLEKTVVLDKDGNQIFEYERPTHPLFGKMAQYKPQKVAVDKRGNIYVASKGNTNGIIQVAGGSGGDFLGYFGANQTRVNLLTMFRRLVYTEEQMARLTDAVPVAVTNMAIDQQGLVYAVSTGDASAPLKKLNMSGRNILDVSFSDSEFTAVAVGLNGNIFAAARSGRIYEYNSEGDLIFIFGAPDDGKSRVGLFKTVSGMAVDERGWIYVSDSEKNSVQAFAPTEFADLVHEAFRLFDEGKYLESKEPWTQIQKMNSQFAYASTGLGEAAYRERQYAEALENFRLGNNRRGYSDAFWELRSNWLGSNLGIAILVLAALAALWQAAKWADRKTAFLTGARNAASRVRNINLVDQCMFAFRNIKNPSDAAYGIKHEGKAGWKSSGILLLAFFVLFVLEKYFSGFLFKSVPNGYYDLAGDFFTVFSVFALSVGCLYLVCTITDGEATLKELFAGAIYAFAPIFLIKPGVIIFTNVLTLGEGFFITLLNVVAVAWTAILAFLAIKNLNDYSFGKTLKVVLLGAFACIVCALLVFIVYVLVSQFIDFVSSIAGEAVFKLAKT
ncbi:MAG: SBBP repeat-containing protein [Clostridiales bacterium]|jgi:sugar lactone lactonase YvrE|nr:SBBP repeat-containing protein [Clostridiales bacterium]